MFCVFQRVLNKGDSILLDANPGGIIGGFEPLIYHWDHLDGIGDTVNNKLWFKPSETTEYSVWVEDLNGCKSHLTTAYQIIVLPATSASDVKFSNDISIKHIGNRIYFQNPMHKEFAVEIVDLSGRFIGSFLTKADFFDFDWISEKLFIVKVSADNKSGSRIIKR